MYSVQSCSSDCCSPDWMCCVHWTALPTMCSNCTGHPFAMHYLNDRRDLVWMALRPDYFFDVLCRTWSRRGPWRWCQSLMSSYSHQRKWNSINLHWMCWRCWWRWRPTMTTTLQPQSMIVQTAANVCHWIVALKTSKMPHCDHCCNSLLPIDCYCWRNYVVPYQS